MWHSLLTRVNTRSTIISIFSTVLVLSLVCSLSIQSSNADAVIAAAAQQTEPLQVGQRAPRFVVKTVDNETFEFEPSELQRPAVIVTFRGGWCPYCNMHLSELRNVIPEISDLGVDVLFLSGDRPELLYQSLNAETQESIAGLDYKIYSDADAEAAIAFGIAFTPSDKLIQGRIAKGQDIAGSSILKHGVLAVPAVYAIDAKGVISFAFVEPDYKVRLPADELLKTARELVQ